MSLLKYVPLSAMTNGIQKDVMTHRRNHSLDDGAVVSRDNVCCLKIAVTGGRGFLGKELISKLVAQGHDVRALTRMVRENSSSRVNWYEGDISSGSIAMLKDFVTGADVVIHIAGENTDVSVMEKLHVEGTEKLIAACKAEVAHWIQISSCGVYGPIRSGVVNEDTPLNTQGIYETTKLKAEQLVWSAAQNGYFTATILRPSVVYGASMSNESLRSLIRIVQRKMFFFIGPKQATYNFVHVSDLADVILASIDHQGAKNEIFNLSECIQIEKMISLIAASAKVPMPTLRLPEAFARTMVRMFSFLPGFPLTNSRIDAFIGKANYSSDKIKRCLNWQPKTSLSAGLVEMIENMRDK